jgi:DNA-binding NarL/FixJ family response regulator
MSKKSPIGVLIIDGHSIVGTSIASLLDTYEDVTVMGVVTREIEAMEFLTKNSVDVVSIDIEFKDRNEGLNLIRNIHKTFPSIRIIVLTNLLEEGLLTKTLKEGVVSYLLKSCSVEEFILAIQGFSSNRLSFSPEVIRMIIKESSAPAIGNISERETEVLKLVCLGKNNKEISQELNISISTVQFHVGNVFRKLNVHNRTEAATYAIHHKLVFVPLEADASRPWSGT